MARELPIHNGRLTTDLDADGHRIVNLPGGSTETISWVNVTDKPTFAMVATSGSYNDLTNKPTIPAPVDISGKVDGDAIYQEWLASPPNPYPGGAIVSHNGFLYQLGEEYAGTDSEPGVSEEWNAVRLEDLKQDALSSAQLANINAVPNKANTSDVAAALAQKLDGAAEYPAWVEGDAYTVDDVVSHNGRIWKSLATNFDEPGTDPTKWDEVLVGDLLDGKQDALSASQLANIAAVPGKMPMYPMVSVAPSNGTLTVAPYTVATYTAGTTSAAFTVAVGAGTTGMARDCELVIDCTATGAVAPTVTWPSNFHPRTDAATDFACEAGVRNVYFISEFSPGEFAVGGWQETAGGNAT